MTHKINTLVLLTIKAKINKAQDLIAAKADLEKNEADFVAESEAQKELAAKFESEKSNQPKIKELGEKAAAIKALLPDYDELLERIQVLKESYTNTQLSLFNFNNIPSNIILIFC